LTSKTSQALVRVLLAAVLLNGAAGRGARAQEGVTPEQFTQDFDHLWTQLRDGYAYFDRKETDWGRVREFYRPRAREVKTKREFVAFLERVLEELYDPHTHLKVNTAGSPRLVPTGLDVWAEWRDGRAFVTQLREGFSAEQAGLRVGMEIVSINGRPVEAAVNGRLGVALRRADAAARGWALRALLAGTRDTRRVVEARRAGGATAAFRLDLPGHRTVDNFRGGPRVEWKVLRGAFGYIKVNDLGSDETVAGFDAALEQVRATRGLILDLRATQSGGNTSVAEPIMGRLITRRAPYQRGVPARGAAWTREVSPRGDWAYVAPVVVLVGRWTASMGEGMAVGLDGMGRATVVGTRMAGLNGAVFDLQLPNTGVRLNYAAEKLFHLNGTPREEFVPPVLVKLSGAGRGDVILAEGVRALRRIIRRRHAPRRPSQTATSGSVR
jgi:C-terminal processing protease CtpA/Prc